MQNDFNYLSDIFSEFFSNKHINNRLKLIHEEEISGWEVWLQIELALFLANHPSEPECYREMPLKFDRRREFEKIHFRPDFLIRKKGWRIENYAAVEIKQHPNPVSCIKNMLKDVEKVGKMKTSELNMRSLWVLGIFKADSELDLDELFDEHVDSDTNISTYDFIGNTGFAYMLF